MQLSSLQLSQLQVELATLRARIEAQEAEKNRTPTPQYTPGEEHGRFVNTLGQHSVQLVVLNGSESMLFYYYMVIVNNCY